MHTNVGICTNFLMSTWFMDDPLESVTITSAGLTNENLYKLMNMKHLTNLHLGTSSKLLLKPN